MFELLQQICPVTHAPPEFKLSVSDRGIEDGIYEDGNNFNFAADSHRM